jgi:hypothetical protein
MSGVLGASAYGCFVRAFANRRNLAFAANGRAGPGVLGRDNVFRLNKEVARDVRPLTSCRRILVRLLRVTASDGADGRLRVVGVSRGGKGQSPEPQQLRGSFAANAVATQSPQAADCRRLQHGRFRLVTGSSLSRRRWIARQSRCLRRGGRLSIRCDFVCSRKRGVIARVAIRKLRERSIDRATNCSRRSSSERFRLLSTMASFVLRSPASDERNSSHLV